MVEGQLRDKTRSIPTFFLHNENQSTIKTQTYISRSPPKADGADEMGDASWILVWDTPRTTVRGGHMRIASAGLSQSVDRTAGGPQAYSDRIPEETGIHRDSQWDTPRKRALFTSDGPDSTRSGSDTPEGHADRPPDVEYSERLMTDRRHDEGGTERPCSPHIKLEMAVIQLQKDFDDCRMEFEITRKLIPAVDRRPLRQAGFTSTPVPRYSGKSNWEQYREIFEAIVCSPVLSAPRTDPIPTDQDLLIQRLLGTIGPPKPVAQERSAVTELETMLLNWLPVGTIMEENAASPHASTVFAEGCFSCGVLTHTTENCGSLDESFPFLPTGWQVERIGDQFILGPGSPARPRGQQTGNAD